ncbi:MAG: hypothetical protein EOO05_02455 [Chitinophagaceae bacterium]|nr:MAG: hypothetical protein EOO05_02455 [Chitinophagaceae bacterium]
MKIHFVLAVAMIIFSQVDVNGQGCVAIRSTGASCSIQKPHEDSSKWQINTNYRFFRSYKHFKGRDEQKERQVLHNEVINYSHSLDLSIIRKLNDRWSLALNMPLLANKRTSLYEHGFKERGSTESFGLGDMRLSASYWLVDPKKNTRGNVQVGMGIKFATGDYNYKDYWTGAGPGGTDTLFTVDQSIQLGDGGTGITTEFNAYYRIAGAFQAYASGFYLFNPKEVNGTRTYREYVSATLYNETICSVPDQYQFRAGFSYGINKFSFLAGGRIDAIPVYDLIGKSTGFRRPGYAIAVEPGVTYMTGRTNLFLTVPFAVERNRTQSVTDKERSKNSGTYVIGDAAFSDYVINLGMSVRF